MTSSTEEVNILKTDVSIDFMGTSSKGTNFDLLVCWQIDTSLHALRWAIRLLNTSCLLVSIRVWFRLRTGNVCVLWLTKHSYFVHRDTFSTLEELQRRNQFLQIYWHISFQSVHFFCGWLHQMFWHFAFAHHLEVHASSGNCLLWTRQNGQPPTPVSLHVGCSYHLHSSHHFLST